MILEYHRPRTLEEALALLQRSDVLTLPLGGGTVLSRQRKPDFAVVDLQALGLNYITREGQLLRIGAAATLQQLYEFADLPETIGRALRRSLQAEAGLNQRNATTLGGSIFSCDGRSPFATALLALDPRLVWAADEKHQPLGDFLPFRGASSRRLLTEVRVSLNISLRVEQVARTPLDRPLVIAAIGRWPSGRTRITLGGYGAVPVLALDGPEPVGAAEAAREAYRFAGDEWASAGYRMEVAARLISRILAEPSAEETEA